MGEQYCGEYVRQTGDVIAVSLSQGANRKHLLQYEPDSKLDN